MDAAFGAVLLVSATVCVLILLTTAGYELSWADSPYMALPRLWPMCLPYAVLLTSVLITRRQLFRDGPRPRTYVALTVTTLIGFWVSFLWFQFPMHDIAMIFGSHGRWGCQTLRADGSRVHLIRDDTVPWLLFAPILVGIALHGFRSWKSGAFREQAPHAEPSRRDAMDSKAGRGL
jgi:hypothetical protein